MADDQNFPTAIVPARPGTAIERYDRLAHVYGDPMETLMQMQSPVLGSDDEEVRLRAAAELLPYRHPKLKVSEVRHSGDGAPGGGMTININIGAGKDPVTAAVDVTPAVDPLS
jgi:hypothetical protein